MLTQNEQRILKRKLYDYSGKTQHLVLNEHGSVCVGVAHILPTLESALALSFVNAQGLKASPEEIERDYKAIQTLAPKRIASFYKQHMGLVLPDSEIERLMDETLKHYYSELESLYAGFDGFPVDAKLALYDIIFSMGPEDLSGWITFNECVRAQNWQRAALDSARGFPITAVRNIYVQALFEKAHRASKAVEEV